MGEDGTRSCKLYVAQACRANDRNARRSVQPRVDVDGSSMLRKQSALGLTSKVQTTVP